MRPYTLTTIVCGLALSLPVASLHGQVNQWIHDADPRSHVPKFDPIDDLDKIRHIKNEKDAIKFIRDKFPLPSDAEKKIREAAYFAYKDHVVKKNRGLKAQRLTGDEFHFEMIYPLLRFDIDEVDFYFDAYVPGKNAAVTFGNSVYIDSKYDATDPSLTKLLAHELVHVRQVERLGGEKEFAQRYMGQIGKSQVDILASGKLDRLDFDRGDVKYIHGSLGLEQEANYIEQFVPSYNYRLFNVDYPAVIKLKKVELKKLLAGLKRDHLGATLIGIDGPTLKVGVENMDRATLKVAVDVVDMMTLKEAMQRVDGATLTEILKALDGNRLSWILPRLDKATQKEVLKRHKDWRAWPPTLDDL